MPQLRSSLELPASVAEVFAVLSQPARLAEFFPPSQPLTLVAGPDLVGLGSVLSWQGKRWGLTHRLVVEVVDWKSDALLVWEQRRGTLQRFTHTQNFLPSKSGMHLEDEITFEPPGGILGLTVTAELVLADLRNGLQYRDALLRSRYVDS